MSTLKNKNKLVSLFMSNIYFNMEHDNYSPIRNFYVYFIGQMDSTTILKT